MELNQKVKQRREALGVSQAALADAVSKKAGKKFSQQSLTKLEKTPGAGSRFMVFILEVLDELEGQNKNDPKASAEWIGGIDPWDDGTPLRDDEVQVRMFTEVEIEGGNGSSHAVEFNGPGLRFAKRTLAKAGVPPEAAACAKVTGNSMEPVLPEGTTVGVNTADTKVRDGKIYTLDHLGQLRVKLLYRQPGGGLRISSFNRDEYPDEVLTAEQAEAELKIIGKVFWWSVLEY
jgi:phage repressor protein C with HTH and peptisase S24 domain